MTRNLDDLLEKAPLEQWPIEKLVPYEKNPKLHNVEHINKLAWTALCAIVITDIYTPLA